MKNEIGSDFFCLQHQCLKADKIKNLFLFDETKGSLLWDQ